ncbi:MAG TPA: TadE/TadG family type IV pilus assembly protein [Xanthobacteraceae bacterium]|nr:TadE/TadG family type IV pilus assembly protein [Xanthobacteraceae bacterium]
MLRTLAKFLPREVARFGAAGNGATAVEFALVAPAFLAMVIAVLETTLFLFAQATLQSAAVQTGRLFMTGQAQNANLTQAQFAADVCPLISALFICNNLMVNVTAYSNFSSASASAPTLTYNSKGQVTNTWTYAPGTPGQVMVVQLIYQWPIVGGPFGSVLPNLGNGTTEMMGVTSFRVEPY